MKKILLTGFTIIMMIFSTRCNQGVKSSKTLFSRENLIAWCIVPFDAAHRTPEQRASMLRGLGLSRMAYDYRDEHIPQFSREIAMLEKYGISLDAVWFWLDSRDGALLSEANRAILGILEETGTTTELWVSFPESYFDSLPEAARLDKAAGIVTMVLGEAERIGCTLALYNHGGWFGEPENLVEIIETIGSDKIRIVYNFHHGHGQVERFPELLEMMLPYLSAININGMKANGPKIITLGEGDLELRMLREIASSGYDGPIGILGHTEGEDIRVVLERNLEGLDELKMAL